MKRRSMCSLFPWLSILFLAFTPGPIHAADKPVQRLHAPKQKTKAFTERHDIQVRCLDIFRGTPRKADPNRKEHPEADYFHLALGDAYVTVFDGDRPRQVVPFAHAIRMGWLKVGGKAVDPDGGPWWELQVQVIKPGKYVVDIKSPCLFWSPPNDPKAVRIEQEELGRLISLYESRRGVIAELDAAHKELLTIASKAFKASMNKERDPEHCIDFLYWSLWNNRPKDFAKIIESWKADPLGFPNKLQKKLDEWQRSPQVNNHRVRVGPVALRGADGAPLLIHGVDAEQLQELQEILREGGIRYLTFAESAAAELRLTGDDGLVVPRSPDDAVLAEISNIARVLRECPAALRDRVMQIARAWPLVSSLGLRHARNALEAPLLRARFNDGRPELAHPTNPATPLRLRPVSLDPEEFPAAWRDLPGGSQLWLVDVSGLNGPQTQEVMQLLRNIEGTAGVQIHCVVGPEGESRQRLTALPQPGQTVLQSHASVANAFGEIRPADGDGGLMLQALNELAGRSLPASNLHVLFGHDDGKSKDPTKNPIQQWLEDARNERFRGGPVLVVACNLNPELIRTFVTEARANGASSVVVSTRSISVPAYVFAAHVLAHLERIPEGLTPRGVWEYCYAEAANRLETCGNSPERLRFVFGETLAKYLVRNDQVDAKRRDNLLAELRQDAGSFMWMGHNLNGEQRKSREGLLS
jgi:hypothetical protein